LKIALVRLSALGDIVFSMMAAAIIKQQYPNSHITWIVDERFKDVVQNSPFVDEVVSIKLKPLGIENISNGAAKIKALGHFDIVYDLQGLVKSGLVTAFLDSSKKVGFSYKSAREGLATLFYTDKVISAYQKNIIERYIDLLGFKTLKEKPKLLGYGAEAKEKAAVLIKADKKNILINMSASKANKVYPWKKMQTVTQAFGGENIMVLGGEMASLPEMNLDEIKALVDSCDLVIGGDTGITHMAWAMNVPSITIFGATPARRNACETQINRLLYMDEAIDAKRLDYDDFSIANIEPDLVIETAKGLL
jgi:heptosyltransferase-1